MAMYSVVEAESNGGVPPKPTRSGSTNSISSNRSSNDTHQSDENPERGNWSGRMDFLLSAIGYAVGLGNVWRFPYKAYANGGASFLIPYVLMLLCAGLPLFFMEMVLGQFSSLGPVTVWRMSPLFKGIGWGMVCISFLVSIYYNMIIAYTLYYTFASFTSVLPWADCKDEWIQYGCQPRYTNASLRNATVELCQQLRQGAISGNSDPVSGLHENFSRFCTPKSPSEVYWEREVLDLSESVLQGGGEFRWQLVLCLLLAWVIIFLCLCRGIKSTGKVVYFTATFPYVVLVILLMRNCLLPGAGEGIKFYIVPDWSKLKVASVWHSAAIQIFYSLGIGFGGLETMASYNRFRNNVYRDAVLVAVLNCATSVFAGFVIFSVMGFMAHESGTRVEDVVASGPGLAFIAYPEGLAMMPAAPFWSVLFFLMLFTLGLDSQFAMMETIISATVDEFPWLRKGRRKVIFTAALCVFLFLLGLPQCARNGLYVMHLLDWYSASYSLMIVAFLEVIAISWIYGLRRFCEDIHLMIGYSPNYYWIVTWKFVTPFMLMFIIVFAAATHTNISYGQYVYEDEMNHVGFFLVVFSLLPIVFCAFYEVAKERKWFQTIINVTRPKDEWGPALNKFRTGQYKPIRAEDEYHGAEGEAQAMVAELQMIQKNSQFV